VYIVYLYKKALLNLDRTIAILFLILAIIFTILMLYIQYKNISMPIVIFLSSIFYLLFRDKISFNDKFPKILKSNQLICFSHIILFVSISFLLWSSWSNLYYKPPLYFVVVLIAAASIIINIFCLSDIKGFSISIVLLKIVTLSYVIYANNYYQFNGIYGTDPWRHNMWIQDIINIGHLSNIPLFVKSYYLIPLFHINSGMTSIVSNMSIYSSIFASCGAAMAMAGVFAFIIGRTVTSSKAALLTALIVPLTSNNIEKATEIIPMSLGYIFFLLMICFIFLSKEKSSKYRILFIFLSIIVILTHTIAALLTLLSLIAIFVGVKFYNSITKTSASHEVFSLVFIGTFMVIMIIIWMQNAPLSNTSFFGLVFTLLVKSLQMDAQFALNAPSAIAVSYNILLFDQASFLLVVFFAIIGAFIFLHPQMSTPYRMGLVFIVGTIFVIIYSFYLSNLGNILPYRWYIFLYIPLSILAVTGLLWISKLINNNTRRLAVVMFVILAIIFGMTTNSLANRDSPLFFNNAVRVGYTQSEFASIHTLSDVKAGVFVTDLYFSTIFPYVLTDDEFNEMTQSNKSIFIQRNYYLNNPGWDKNYRISIVKGKSNNIIVQNELILNFMKKEYRIDNAPMMYNNGIVKAYVI